MSQNKYKALIERIKTVHLELNELRKKSEVDAHNPISFAYINGALMALAELINWIDDNNA